MSLIHVHRKLSTSNVLIGCSIKKCRIHQVYLYYTSYILPKYPQLLPGQPRSGLSLIECQKNNPSLLTWQSNPSIDHGWTRVDSGLFFLELFTLRIKGTKPSPTWYFPHVQNSYMTVQSFYVTQTVRVVSLYEPALRHHRWKWRRHSQLVTRFALFSAVHTISGTE